MSEQSFIELHCHTDIDSNLRLIDSTNKVEAVLDHANKIGLRGLALTGHESVSSHIKGLNHVKKIHETNPNFQLILGNEIYLCHDTPSWVGEDGKTRYTIESNDFFHFILLAKDAIGHEQLRRLSSRAWERCYNYKRVDRVPTFYSDVEEIVGKAQGHLVASSACLGGEFPKLVLQGDVQACQSFVEWCQKQFGAENFFIELQPGRTEDQMEFNKRAVKFCKHFGLKWVITNDVHYLTKDKRQLHANFLNSKEEERELDDFYESTYFKNCDKMRERMEDYLDVEDIEAGFRSTLEIGEMCKGAGDYGLFCGTIVPQRKLPQFSVRHTLNVDEAKYPYIHRYYQSTEPQDLWLMKQLEDGVDDKHMPMDEEHLGRINYELEQLWTVSEKLKQPMSAYYNLTQLIVEIMWNDDGKFTPPNESDDEAIVGVGRGSVGGWYLAYLMSIMQLDPIKWGAVAWRHLHGLRPDTPDVDLDSGACRKDAILKRVKYVFGDDHCLNTITFRTETTKAAIKTSCRGLGIDTDIAGELSSLVPVSRGKVWTLKQCLNGTEENGYQPVRELINRFAEFPNLLETVEEIEGLVSGRGVHASSVFLYNSPYVVHNSFTKAPKGTPCTAWDMHDSEACSGLKED